MTFPKLKWNAGAVCVEIERAELLASEIAAERDKFGKALEAIRMALDLSAVTLASYGDGTIGINGLVKELLEFRLSIFKALEGVGK